jgi:hypothetical protein
VPDRPRRFGREARSANLEGIVNIAADGSDDPKDVAPAGPSQGWPAPRDAHHACSVPTSSYRPLSIGAGLSSSAFVARRAAPRNRSGITIPVRECCRGAEAEMCTGGEARGIRISDFAHRRLCGPLDCRTLDVEAS